MSVKIRQRFHITDGIRIEDRQRSAREREADKNEVTMTRVTDGEAVAMVGGLGF
jgi:hypothetical protein